ncbi:asparagine synthase-related protein [Paenibacillus xylaniclasticus]|uniref:asparagine synthase-related protein n=1 Tax=Paenibacillus xylaniclasticus TaxID=588083 RepID=UPI0013DFD448|nr:MULTISPECIES: asparagine synthase-related protein [Paenibacillus]
MKRHAMEDASFSALGIRALSTLLTPQYEVQLLTVGEDKLESVPVALSQYDSYCVLTGYVADDEIRKQLSATLVEHASAAIGSDEELIIKAYEKYGIDAFRILNGYYSGVLFAGPLTIAFTSKGSGPSLYYRFDSENQRILISSELKAFPDNDQYILPFESFNEADLYRNAYLTSFKDTYKLVPGNTVVINNVGRIARGQSLYFTPNRSITIFDEQQACQLIRTSLESIVDAYPIRSADCLVSGGLDSSIITYLATKRLSSVELYTAGTEDYNEFIPAGVFAKSIGKQLNYLLFEQDRFLDSYVHTIGLVEHFHSKYIEYLVPITISHSLLQGRGQNILSGYGSDILFAGFAKKGMSARAIMQLVWDEYISTYWSNETSQNFAYYFDKQVFYPFLESSIVEASFMIDPALKFKNGIEKYILRKSFDGEIDPEILWRKKVGVHQGTGCEDFFTQFLQLQGREPDAIRYAKDQFAYHILKLLLVDKVEVSNISLHEELKKQGA